MTAAASLRALAVAFPAGVRTNDYWHQRHPALVAQAQQKTLARLWTERATSSALAQVFDEEMQRYGGDPFRGTRERRVLAPGETPLGLELRAARRALDAAALAPAEVDLVIAASFLPDQLGVGNATFLAGELGTRGAAFNVESACSGSLVALQTAAALVRGGDYRRVLCVVSCTYSRVTDERDTLSWTVGDGAAAFVVGPGPAGEGLLGASLRHTAVSCGALSYQLRLEDGAPQVRMEATPKAGRALREISETCLLESCEGALRAAGVTLADIDFFVFNSPVAWYAAFCARALGVPAERTVDTYPEFGNVGPVLMPANLHRAATTGRLRPGALVLLYTVGSVSSAGAAVLRWGDVRVAPEV